ncbi:phosphatidylserine decarboxylase [Tenacibaculum sp. MAR_2009_124]|uniref:phosphatidylserine decarboxylase family protein n=1 Tax=Tenacibaculum sp. MAR_2009_124 TaxID=1250059 RepID=UPI0008994722|nr:phosphatidylserine decarboxylase family protein [Tenacibaculum sp. MAR_2009_124]SEB45144.1 phosphatidylserine decarboxylase [Tenacibaculum sp. MAR_2009_124]
METLKKELTARERFSNNFEHRYGVISGYIDKDLSQIGKWLSDIVKLAHENKVEKYEPSVRALQVLLEKDQELRELVNKTIIEGLEVHKHFEPDAPYAIETIENLLTTLNYIITRAPKFQPNISHSAFPMSGLFVYMMATPNGWILFRNETFNQALSLILKEWCAYLDSPASLDVVTTNSDGWLSPESVIKNNLDQFVTKEMKLEDPSHWTFKSFNDFFHRQIIPVSRPIDGVGNDHVIVSANDGTVYRIAENVKREDDIYAKNQPYSLVHLLDNNFVDDFVGGTVFQSFLSGNDYHRWRAPISGRVIKAEVIPGYMFSELLNQGDHGFDPTAGTYSQGYEANVNTRGLVIIEHENPAIGKVAVIPIGITEISSVEIQIKPGDYVKKGDELGWFSYGGSSMCLVFQPNAIKQFTVVNPLPNNNSNNGPFIRVAAQIAIANIK